MSEQPISLNELELKVGGVTMVELSGLEPARIWGLTPREEAEK